MHEIGMLYQTAETATLYADENHIDEVKVISIEIGELSGAFPAVFTDYFPFVAEQYPKLKNAKLQIHEVAGEGLCNECHCLYNVMQNEGICPNCHSFSKTILSGRDIKLLSIGY